MPISQSEIALLPWVDKAKQEGVFRWRLRRTHAGTMALDCDRVPNDSNKLDKPICRFPVETLVGVPAISLVTKAPRTCLQVNRSI